MDFLGIGPMELLVILIIALIVFGPNRLPEIAAQLGKFINNMKRAGTEMTRELNREIEENKRSIAAATEEARAVTKTSLAVEEEPETPKQPVAAAATEDKATKAGSSPAPAP
ncbi:MAG: twin-arginine translocase TatA/TatE family subunit [Chloroflexi bacterium]|nr:twin-arginine translocase TatA/TatE family subunit [Chloroflexota bacterium]